MSELGELWFGKKKKLHVLRVRDEFISQNKVAGLIIYSALIKELTFDRPGLTVTELSRVTGFGRASVYRIIKSMPHLIEKDISGHYLPKKPEGNEAGNFHWLKLEKQ